MGLGVGSNKMENKEILFNIRKNIRAGVEAFVLPRILGREQQVRSEVSRASKEVGKKYTASKTEDVWVITAIN